MPTTAFLMSIEPRVRLDAGGPRWRVVARMEVEGPLQICLELIECDPLVRGHRVRVGQPEKGLATSAAHVAVEVQCSRCGKLGLTVLRSFPPIEMIRRRSAALFVRARQRTT